MGEMETQVTRGTNRVWELPSAETRDYDFAVVPL